MELCSEAIRLILLLLEHPPAATPETSALAAMMHLHAARLPARLDEAGDLSALADQDRSRWFPESRPEGARAEAGSANCLAAQLHPDRRFGGSAVVPPR